MPLARDLAKKNFILVGTLKNKQTSNFTHVLHPQTHSNIFGLYQDLTFIHFCAKRTAILSTMHNDVANSTQTSKSEVILHFNKTKGTRNTCEPMVFLYVFGHIIKWQPMMLFSICRNCVEAEPMTLLVDSLNKQAKSCEQKCWQHIYA